MGPHFDFDLALTTFARLKNDVFVGMKLKKKKKWLISRSDAIICVKWCFPLLLHFPNTQGRRKGVSTFSMEL